MMIKYTGHEFDLVTILNHAEALSTFLVSGSHYHQPSPGLFSCSQTPLQLSIPPPPFPSALAMTVLPSQGGRNPE